MEPVILLLGFLLLVSVVLFSISARRYIDLVVVIKFGIRHHSNTLNTNALFVRTYLDGDLNYAWSCTLFVFIQSLVIGAVLYWCYPYVDGRVSLTLLNTIAVFVILRVVLSIIALIKAARYKRARPIVL